MIKIKLNINKYIPYILIFIVLFAISSVVLIVLKKGIEKKLEQYYSNKLLEIREEQSRKESKEKAVNEEKGKIEAVRTLREFSPEEIRKYQQELRQRIEWSEKKVALLEKKEKEIESFKSDIENRKNEITTMRERLDEALMFISAERIDLDSDMVVFKESQKKNLKRLADIYASMDALKAADVLSKLNQDTSAKILTGMPFKKSAKILSGFDTTGAATISEKIKNMQIANQASDESLKARNIKNLAGIYQKMDTGKAVSIIKKLDNETAVSILSKMNEKKLARILELVETDEASRLTDEIREIIKMEFQKKDGKIEGA